VPVPRPPRCQPVITTLIILSGLGFTWYSNPASGRGNRASALAALKTVLSVTAGLLLAGTVVYFR
jgi:hypothetical protein